MTRKITNKILDMIDDGAIEAYEVVLACLKYMSEDDVADMAHSNEFIVEEEDLDDDTMEEDDVDHNGNWYDTSSELL